jgi:predicted transcriptional regulator
MDQITVSNNNLNLLEESNYLVTKAVSTSDIPQQKVSSDLEMLKKAEKKSLYKANIAKGKKDPQVYIALSALRLSNPFKGY